MIIYIPFIHKVIKKDKPKQISLYIDIPYNYSKEEEKEKIEEKEIIIELF